jgi:hypothetical protein
MTMELETGQRTGGGEVERRTDQWLVVNYHQGLEDMSKELNGLCQVSQDMDRTK